jgi:uncharacterized membrane protein YeiH
VLPVRTTAGGGRRSPFATGLRLRASVAPQTTVETGRPSHKSVTPLATRDAARFASGLVSAIRTLSTSDAAGLALFCVTGASTALDHGLAAAPAVILGAITGIGGGILRDILVRQIPVVLREGLYAIPALIGAAIVVGAARAGAHGPAAPIIGAAVCFVIRLVGLALGLNIPRARRINRD